MTYVQLPLWGENAPPAEEAGFADMLLTPVPPPKPDPELSPEQQQLELFHVEADKPDNYANEAPGSWHRAGRDLSEVCELSGWPPQHTRIGRHCPHGLFPVSDEREEIIDYTRKGSGHQS